MRSLSGQRLGAVAIAGSLAACASLTGLAGGEPDAGAPVDASLPISIGEMDTSVPRDSSADAASRDAAAPDAAKDAALDAAPEASPPVGFCATQPDATFCDDFEGDAGLSGWSISNETTISHEEAHSPSSSVQVVAPAGSYAGLMRTIPNPGADPTQVTLSFALYVDVGFPPVRSFVATMHAVTAGGEGKLALLHAPDGGDALVQVAPDGGAPLRQFPLTRPLPLGVWTLVTLNVNLAPLPSPFASVTIDGQSALSKSLLDSTLQTGKIAIELEVSPVGNPAQLYFDDVVVTLTP